MLNRIFQAIRNPRALRRLLAPDTDREERRDIGRSAAFQDQREAITALARKGAADRKAAELLVARENQNTEFKAVEGLGELQARIPLETYLEMQVKYGEDCWGDSDFIEAFLRDNAHLRVKISRGTRGQEYGGRPNRRPGLLKAMNRPRPVGGIITPPGFRGEAEA